MSQGNVAQKTLVLASSRTDSQALPQIAAGERPRLDYLALADTLGSDVLDTSVCDEQAAWKQRIERALASDVRQAQIAWQRRGAYGAWLSTSERVGLPLALRSRLPGGGGGPAHVMIGHVLTSRRKKQIQRLTGVFRTGFDAVICLSSPQEYYLLHEAGVPQERVHRMFHHVDTRFYTPGDAREGDYVLAVGRENRDYATLIAAARLTGLPVVIAASSLWAIRGGVVGDDALPANVTLRREFMPFTELRALYANARMVIVPLHESEYAAGSTGLLEGMAMGRPVIVSRTAGLAEYLQDARTHRSVPLADADALAAAMMALWDNEEERAVMGKAARELVEAKMSLDSYIDGVAAVVRRAVEERK